MCTPITGFYLLMKILPFHSKIVIVKIVFDFLRSLNSWFGSGVMTKSGIILNNQLANFQVPDSSGGTLTNQVGTP